MGSACQKEASEEAPERDGHSSAPASSATARAKPGRKNRKHTPPEEQLDAVAAPPGGGNPGRKKAKKKTKRQKGQDEKPPGDRLAHSGDPTSDAAMSTSAGNRNPLSEGSLLPDQSSAVAAHDDTAVPVAPPGSPLAPASDADVDEPVAEPVVALPMAREEVLPRASSVPIAHDETSSSAAHQSLPFPPIDGCVPPASRSPDSGRSVKAAPNGTRGTPTQQPQFGEFAASTESLPVSPPPGNGARSPSAVLPREASPPPLPRSRLGAKRDSLTSTASRRSSVRRDSTSTQQTFPSFRSLASANSSSSLNASRSGSLLVPPTPMANTALIPPLPAAVVESANAEGKEETRLRAAGAVMALVGQVVANNRRASEQHSGHSMAVQASRPAEARRESTATNKALSAKQSLLKLLQGAQSPRVPPEGDVLNQSKRKK